MSDAAQLREVAGTTIVTLQPSRWVIRGCAGCCARLDAKPSGACRLAGATPSAYGVCVVDVARERTSRIAGQSTYVDAWLATTAESSNPWPYPRLFKVLFQNVTVNIRIKHVCTPLLLLL